MSTTEKTKQHEQLLNCQKAEKNILNISVTWLEILPPSTTGVLLHLSEWAGYYIQAA